VGEGSIAVQLLHRLVAEGDLRLVQAADVAATT
jgi:hypothetical protein